ncbi:TPA: helix-turn-helix domain-containing protein [Escherichia coli]|uniref:helix-turn-helix domain-containing protein n=1 Tax=Escherichia coli TaxID=562 RepID=UPI000A2D8BE4|nr:helix-turn-helix domain-containing protein [Escherichia coli]EFC5313223.1 helix-turn-helix domain-containing protein [Escherichia coli]EFC5847510.1 helix-turn-helix domain-containing protein [Escherichia coli]EFE8211141.1 helix-turn-helix domain-containing protein [Escherichia coli]EFE8556662.1 helix-turn-helix domain-containing protein [Escherichia coli]EFI3555077.1 helix-turn-helix domain-containing protein [Escherichia coli]
MIYGYVRVSTNHQDTELQRLALESAGCVDLKTASGRYNFRNILSAAQYESDLNSERTLAGLAIARSKGWIGGRRPKFSDEQWQQMGALIAAGKSRRYVARIYNVGLSTLYKRFPVTGIQTK